MATELILLVGLQAAGKTTYYQTHLAATHVHVSKDQMSAGNRDAKQRAMIAAALDEGKSVVVDNTNPTPAVRKPLIDLGKAHGARVIAYYFEATLKDAVARNRLRTGKTRVPDVAIYVTAKRLVPPSFDEGFDEVRVFAPQPQNA